MTRQPEGVILPLRITTPRAIYDWHRRPKGRATHAYGEADESGAATGRGQPMPGVVGATGHRLTWELDERTGERLIKLCEEAIADPDIHEAKRNAIEATLRQLRPAYAEWKAANGL